MSLHHVARRTSPITVGQIVCPTRTAVLSHLPLVRPPAYARRTRDCAIRTDSVTFKTGYDYTQRLRTSRSLSPPPPNLFPTRNPDRRRLHRVPPHRASHRTSARPGPQAVSQAGGSCVPPPYRYYPPSCMRVQMEIGDGLSFGRPVRGNDREVEAF